MHHLAKLLPGFLLTCFLPFVAQGAGHDWMASRSDNLLLSQLSIPGTHDSGALFETFPATAKCQDLPIADQLKAGVRFLDIRCRHLKNAFVIHHGQVYQNQNFDDILTAVFAFLRANPSETVIMSVKEESDPSGNTRSFERTFDSYVAKNPAHWILGIGIPKLGDARGKIVLLRRFRADRRPKGIDASAWADNTTFSTGHLRVQDHYNLSNNAAKWTDITSLLAESNSGPADTLFLNFTSGYQSGVFGLPDITGVSNDINARLSDHLTAHPGGRGGILVMDFVTADLCNLIIR